MADHLIPGKLYRITTDFDWVFRSDGVIKNTVAALKNEYAVFLKLDNFKSLDDDEYSVLTFLSACSGEVVCCELLPRFWEKVFERIQEGDG